ncbi:SWIM-type domain-containing protein [Aphis craccivora]|uniref:SWIM-type domain-containing protein n=1 Tax=Aphis craccivora TaxID=307492 RepID=A0A6G0YHQ4_APHCR|nr:SWIM-type domain-containing protein [Aphis craccivora]
MANKFMHIITNCLWWLSPGTSCSSKPLFRVITLSDVDPGNRSLTKVTTPFGAIPTRTFQLLRCL